MAFPAFFGIINLLSKIPKYTGSVFKATKGAVGVFGKVGKSIKQSKAYKIAGDLLGEDPLNYMKSAAKSSLKNGGGVELMKGFIGGISAGSPRFDTSNISSMKTSSGDPVAGSEASFQSMKIKATAFNASTRRLANMQATMLKQGSSGQKVLDTYQRNARMNNFSLAGTGHFEQEMGTFARNEGLKLSKGFGNRKSNQLKEILPDNNIEPPPMTQNADTNTIAKYTYSLSKKQMKANQENIKKINDNLGKVLYEVNRKNDENSGLMMSNLAKYNSQMFSKLVNMVTKLEAVAFQKQQESDHQQTSLLSDKLDSAHTYNVKSSEAIRNELMMNTQSMHSLYEQERLIDDEYRSMENRANRGITLFTIHGMLKQVSEMVHAAFLTPSTIEQNANSVWKEMILDGAKEFGRTVQFSKEMLDIMRLFLKNKYADVDAWIANSVDNWKIHIPMIGDVNIGQGVGKIMRGMYRGLGNGLSFVNDVIFRALLGTPMSLTEHFFGDLNFGNQEQQFIDQGYMDDPATAGDMFFQSSTGNYGIRPSVKRSEIIYNPERVLSINKKPFLGIGDTVHEIQLLDGRKVTLSASKYKKLNNETDTEFKQRLINIAYLEDSDEFMDWLGKNPLDSIKKNNYRYANDKDALSNYYQAIRALSGSSLSFNGVSHWTCKSPRVGSGGEIESYSKTLSAEEQVHASNLIAYFKREKVISDNASSGVVTLDGALMNRLAKALKKATEQRIKFVITSTLRIPSYNTPHSRGIAVDVAMRGESVSGLVNKYYKGQDLVDLKNNPNIKNKSNTHVLLSEDQIRKLAIPNNPEVSSFWKEHLPKHVDFFSTWAQLIDIIRSEGLSCGVGSLYGINWRQYGKGYLDDKKTKANFIDMVHVQISEKVSQLTESDIQDNKSINVEKQLQKEMKDDYKSMSKDYHNISKELVKDIAKASGYKEAAWEGVYDWAIDSNGNTPLNSSTPYVTSSGYDIKKYREVVDPNTNEVTYVPRTQEEIDYYIKHGIGTAEALYAAENFNKLTPELQRDFMNVNSEYKKIYEADVALNGGNTKMVKPLDVGKDIEEMKIMLLALVENAQKAGSGTVNIVHNHNNITTSGDSDGISYAPNRE